MKIKLLFAFLIILAQQSVLSQTNPPTFDLSTGSYQLTGFLSSSASPPPNMAFHFTNDPTDIAFDSHANGNADYNCLFNLSSRSRIVGYGTDGIGFTATSSAQYNNCSSGAADATRYVGVAVLGLNTLNRSFVNVSFTGRTLIMGDGAPTPREFKVVLQYRTSTSGIWTDVPGILPYISVTSGSFESKNITLPGDCENKPNVYLRWVYFQNSSGSGGSRPTVSIDDITVSSQAGVNSLLFQFSNNNTSLVSPPSISTTYPDITDPSKTLGLNLTVMDGNVNVAPVDYTITAQTSNSSIIPLANIVITKSTGLANVTFTPNNVGYCNLTFTLTKGIFSRSLTINIASSNSPSNAAYWPTGISDASAALAIDNDYMIIADNESNKLYTYNRKKSGLFVNSWDFNQGNVLQIFDLKSDNITVKEVDVEAATKSPTNPNKSYWFGSMSNGGNNSKYEPNRDRVFAVISSGSGVNTTFSSLNYKSLLSPIISWGNSYGYMLNASTADGIDPKSIDGFNAEGAVFGPDNTTLFIGLRAPLVPISNRHLAVIAPVLNFETWFGDGSMITAPSFGPPIELDLGGRGIRDIIKLSNGNYIIVAGNYDNNPVRGALYLWTGYASDAPTLVTNINIDQINAEAALEVFQPNSRINFTGQLEIIADNGGTSFYGDGISAKDLTNLNYKKFRTEVFTGAVALPVSLETFVGKKLNSNLIELSWVTSKENKLKEFILEKSTDAKHFEGITTIEAKEADNDYLNSYRFEDHNITSSITYYKLKMVDLDGSYTYSKTISIQNDPEMSVVGQLYPNPSTGSFVTIDIMATTDETWEAVLTTTTGYLVSKENKEIKKGLNRLIFNISSLTKGLYVLDFTNQREVFYRKMVKH